MAKSGKTYVIRRIGRLTATLIGGSVGLMLGVSFALVLVFYFALLSVFAAIGVAGSDAGAGGIVAMLGMLGIMALIMVGIYLALFTFAGLIAGAGTSLIYNGAISKIRPLKVHLEEI